MALPSVRVYKQNKTKSDKQNLSRNKKLAENKAASNLHGPTEQDLDQDLGPDCDPRLPTKKKRDPRPNNSFKVATLFAHLPLKFNATTWAPVKQRESELSSVNKAGKESIKKGLHKIKE